MGWISKAYGFEYDSNRLGLRLTVEDDGISYFNGVLDFGGSQPLYFVFVFLKEKQHSVRLLIGTAFHSLALVSALPKSAVE